MDYRFLRSSKCTVGHSDPSTETRKKTKADKNGRGKCKTPKTISIFAAAEYMQSSKDTFVVRLDRICCFYEICQFGELQYKNLNSGKFRMLGILLIY